MSNDKHAHNAHLLLEFGRSIGLPDLRFDKDGTCVLAFDETVIFINSEKDNALTIYAPLAEVPEEKKATIQPMLLNANFLFQATRGATLSMAEYSSYATIAIRIKASLLNLKSLTEATEEFIQLVDFWQQHMASMLSDIKPTPAKEVTKEQLTPYRQGLKA